MLSDSLDCHFFYITPSVFSNDYNLYTDIKLQKLILSLLQLVYYFTGNGTVKTKLHVFNPTPFYIGTDYEYDGNVFVAWVLQVRRAEVVTK
jgi:hypothetical protein